MLLDACKVCSFPGMHPIVVVKTARRPLSSSTQLTGRTGHLIYLVCCIWTFLFLAPNILNSIFFYLGVKYQHYSRCHKSEVPFVFSDLFSFVYTCIFCFSWVRIQASGMHTANQWHPWVLFIDRLSMCFFNKWFALAAIFDGIFSFTFRGNDNPSMPIQEEQRNCQCERSIMGSLFTPYKNGGRGKRGDAWPTVLKIKLCLYLYIL